MQFAVPQFIDIEDKVFGPLTFKQFIYVLGGVGATIVFYYIFPLIIAIFFIIPVAGIAFMFAFKPIHGRPFSVVFESAFKYLFGNKLYLWRKTEKGPEKTASIQLLQTLKPEEKKIPRVKEGKLEDLSWNLDVQRDVK